MRQLIGLVALLSLAGLSAGQEQTANDRAEELKLLRVGIEAKLKVGDVLREKGDLEGALRVYKEAAKLFDDWTKGTLPFTVKVVEPGRRVKVLPKPVVVVPGTPPLDPVDLALRWLAAHQDEDGRWDCDDFNKHDPADDKCDGQGKPLFDVGVTGLALLAYLGAAHTDRPGSGYRETVARGLRFLRESQDTEGCIGSRATMHYMYNHVLATLALCEAYAMTEDPRCKAPAQQAIAFILKARNPYLGWRYEPRGGENDTSVTSLCTMAVYSAQGAGLEIDRGAYDGARAWIEKMTDPEFGQVGYILRGGSVARMEGKQDEFPPDKSAAMTAAGILTRILCGEDPRKSEAISKGTELCLDRLPRWDTRSGTIDMYYWYLGTMAMFRVGGPAWKSWNEAMPGAIRDTQHGVGSGSRTGSWDPVGAWGSEGGRVYSTALMALCMETYYRYAKVIGVK